jgi:hypothetical protein
VAVPSLANIKKTAWADLTDDEKAAWVTTSDEIALAVALYTYANKTYIEADYSGYYSNAVTDNLAAGMHNMIDLNILELRAQGIYYRQDFRVERSIPLTRIMSLDTLASAGLELTCGERSYYDTSLNSTIYDRTKTAFINAEGGYETDWAVKTGATIDTDVYRKRVTSSVDDTTEYVNAKNASDNYTLSAYEHCAHTINVNTIKTAHVSYNETTQQFSVYIELNLENGGESEAVQNTIKGIRNGSGDQTPSYKNISVTIELWKNGFYKTWNQYEFWQGKAAGFDVSSTFDYYETFLYGEENVPLDEFINSMDDADWAAAKSSYAAFVA